MADVSRTFRLEIVTPDGALPAREVSALDVAAEHGRLTVLAGHQPLVCAVGGGLALVQARDKDPWEEVKIGPGILRVASSSVTLLVRAARVESGDALRP